MDLAEHVAALTGAGHVTEVDGGHQSRVFAARGGALPGPLAVKVLDADLVDRAGVGARTAVVERLAAVEPLVCGPRRLGGRLVTELALEPGPVLVTASQWVDGRPLDPGDDGDAALMGRTLATLHASMRRVDASHLPPVAALRAVPVDPALGDQLLHGDVNHGNLRRTDGSVRVFDLDDCGRGPALFDVADAVYMARFAAVVDASGGTGFERPFVAAYAEASGTAVDHDVLEHLVDVRVAALATWLDDLTTAPIGIRTADPGWHAVLRRFTRLHRGG